MKELKLIVRGYVQGVFYRASIKSAAKELGLTGFARNEPDGTVTVLAQGEEVALKQILKKAWQGSDACKVDKIEEAWAESTEKQQEFEIL